jgi:cystathionine gamma-synthase
MALKKSTVCVHGVDTKFDNTGAISVPIFQSATFEHPGAGQSTGFDYARSKNPNQLALEEVMAKLEGASSAVAMSTGMSAIHVFASLFKPGDHLITSEDLYGVTRRIFFEICPKYNIEFTAVNTADLAAVKEAIRPNTKGIFIETPTNPTMLVTDIAAVTAIAKSIGAITAVDNTFLSPYYQNPIELGADIVIHSGTKYISGHNDSMSGLFITNNTEIADKARWYAKTFGVNITAFEAWLSMRGLKTLALRMERCTRSALEIAQFLKTLPNVTEVYYPGLPEHPSYELSKRQARGFGGMVALKCKNGAIAKKALESVKLWIYAESLGGVESLITCPIYVTHLDIPVEEREKRGISESFLRLSVGIEDAEDLKADLQQALS